MPNVSVTLLGTAQDGGVPQAGCACSRCISVHEGQSPELYPVSIGIIDEEGHHHLIEASRTISRQLRVWSKSHCKPVQRELPPPIQSISLTHLHLGHIDGLGQFGREAMNRKNLRLLASQPVLDELSVRSLLAPFAPEVIPPEGKGVKVGRGVMLEFHRVPHRDHEVGRTHAIIVRGPKRSLLFLPDHDTWEETLALHKMDSIRAWLASLNVDVALLDGTFFVVDEVAGSRADAKGIPHPPISETLGLLGRREEGDSEVWFVHLNHTNPVMGEGKEKAKVESLGWGIGMQGQVFEL